VKPSPSSRSSPSPRRRAEKDLNEDLIYFDHNATTPILPEAAAAVAEALGTLWGNPSSVHGIGRRARAAVEKARAAIAALVNANPDGLVFTSGGTEADNLAVLGLVRAHRRKANVTGRVISTRLEHPAVLGALTELEREGTAVTFLPVGSGGEVAIEALERALAEAPTTLVTIALANHEIGTIAPIAALVEKAHARGVLFHCDAVQAVGRIAVDVPALGVDALSFSAHKLGGPKGVGALWVRPGLLPDPLVTGGRQERERRAGTENVPGILGFAAAAQIAQAALRAGVSGGGARLGAGGGDSVAALRDRLETGLLAIPGARRNGAVAPRVPGTSNISFAGALAQLVVIALDLEGVAVSSGAACSSGTPAPSSVLLGLGQTPGEAREAVRFSLGAENTVTEVDRVIALVGEVVSRVRAATC
jgi:cysteine desulfurase